MSPPKESRPDNYEMNAKICRLVEQCPFMYDRSHPQYLRKEVCDEAWIRIAKEMGEPVFPCRERWRNIRTSFARSINTNKIPSSANRTKPYYLHEELRFLAKHITPGVPVRRKRATSGSGEECEHIEISVGEETFNGFEQLSATGGEDTDTQNGHETDCWPQLPPHLNDCESGGDGGVGEGRDVTTGTENDSCSSLNGTVGPRRESESSCNRFIRLPPPPLQAAPHSNLQRANDETEVVAALQQIHMSSNGTSIYPPLSKRPRKGSEVAAVEEMTTDRQRHQTNMDASFLQELQSELSIMNHRQKIHLKRRIYEALSEIYPLTIMPTTVPESNPIAAYDATTNQLALAALMSVENLCRNLKCESSGSVSASVPTTAVINNGTAVSDVENPVIPTTVITPTASTTTLLPPKRNNTGMRTRSRPIDRPKTTATANGTAVKDEPEIAD